jgi:hypothetical protein
MFTISMPTTFKVGDTADVWINSKPQQLTWRDEDTLVIEPGDARTILDRYSDGPLVHFTCTAGADEPSYGDPITIIRPGG